MRIAHACRALAAICAREVERFIHQRGRLLAALVRPLLWLAVFAAGFQQVFGVSIIPPYETYVTYQVYILPGLLAMILLFQGMQSSLSMVHDRESGFMKVLLTAPLPRSFALFSKLIAASTLAVLQAYVFLVVAALLGVNLPWSGWAHILPALFISAFMLAALGLLLAVYIRQLENYAGTMNFVIFPMFFISPALYPLWRMRESAADIIHWLALVNPFTYAVELIRFAAYGQLNGFACIVVLSCALLFYLLAVYGHDPQRGFARHVHTA